MKSPSDTGAALAAWLAAHGGRLTAAAIERRAGLRGLHATRDIAAGEQVLCVPRALCFSRHTCESTLGARLARVAGLSDQAVIGACLADERQHGRRWRTFVDAMPASFRERPDGYARADWDLLKGSHAQVRARSGWRALLREHELACAALGPAHPLPLRDFAWGYLAVCTRAFGLNVDGDTFTAIVPLADMLNHANEGNCEPNDDQSVQFELRTNRPVKAGDALTLCYGELPNTSLLARYGFCLDDNPHDRATLTLRFDESHWMYAASVATNGGEAVRELAIGRDPLALHGLQLFTFLRLAALSEERAQREPALDAVEGTGHLPVLDLDNETAALTRLAFECERRLGQFPGEVEKDDALLCRPRLTPTQRDAITVRRGEKRLLRDTIEMAQRAAAALRLPCEQRTGALQALARDGGAWHGYFSQLLENEIHTSLTRSSLDTSG